MGELNKKFKDAVRDIVYLLERNYPKKSSITLVGNRYRLDSAERMILYRGVFKTGDAVIRIKKIRALPSAVPEKLVIDGYNVLITIESYLLGKTVFRSLDGFVRDISGVYGNFTYTEATQHSIELLADYAQNLPIKEGGKKGDMVYLDAPVSKSGELAAHIRRFFKARGIQLSVEVLANPDSRLIEEGESGAVATSDTVIVDKVPICVDIPGYIITHVLKKHILDLRSLLDQPEAPGQAAG